MTETIYDLKHGRPPVTRNTAIVPATTEAQLPDITPGFSSLAAFELAQRAAKLLASSSLVPTEYRGNIANCVIALNMAHRIGADPLMVMQNLVIVHGRPTWSSQFLIATVNTCGRFTALRFEFFGDSGTDGWGCRAWAIEKATGEKLVGSDITIGLAKKEGWYQKNGSKWQSMPQQMLMYRAAAWWTRVYAPELAMGLHTAEEIGDVFDAFPDGTGSYAVTADRMVHTAEGNPVDTTTGEIVDSTAAPAPQPEPEADTTQASTSAAEPSPAPAAETPKRTSNRSNGNQAAASTTQAPLSGEQFTLE